MDAGFIQQYFMTACPGIDPETVAALSGYALTEEAKQQMFLDLAHKVEQPEIRALTLEGAKKNAKRFSESHCSLGFCSATENLKACSICMKAMYCSREHQKADWPRHKKVECIKPKKA